MIEFIEINGRKIGDGHPPYIIAEACINHQGDVKIAKQMVYFAHAMGCDAIKFQMHVLDDEMLRQAPQSDNFEKPLFDTLESTNLNMDEHRILIDVCNSLGIQYLCTPFSRASTDLVDGLDVPAFKVGSGELTNLPLQKHIASKGRPMIVSTGMCTDEEVKETVDTLKALDTSFALTHCVSAYPTPYNRVNLDNIPRYNKLYDIPVGLSDHTIGVYTSIGAVALGACIIEKHFTLDRNLPGPDHQSSLEPYELGELVKGCRAVFEARGDKREIFTEEQEIVAWARESVVAITEIAPGTQISPEHVSVKRPSPGTGAIAAKHLEDIIGKIATSLIAKDEQVLWEQVS
jgi:sialic acid synthase SpsE